MRRMTSVSLTVSSTVPSASTATSPDLALDPVHGRQRQLERSGCGGLALEADEELMAALCGPAHAHSAERQDARRCPPAWAPKRQ